MLGVQVCVCVCNGAARKAGRVGPRAVSLLPIALVVVVVVVAGVVFVSPTKRKEAGNEVSGVRVRLELSSCLTARRLSAFGLLCVAELSAANNTKLCSFVVCFFPLFLLVCTATGESLLVSFCVHVCVWDILKR